MELVRSYPTLASPTPNLIGLVRSAFRTYTRLGAPGSRSFMYRRPGTTLRLTRTLYPAGAPAGAAWAVPYVARTKSEQSPNAVARPIPPPRRIGAPYQEGCRKRQAQIVPRTN